MPTAHDSRVPFLDGALDVGRQSSWVVRRRADERLVPSPHLDDRVEGAQHGHHLRRRGVVCRPIGGKEDRLGAAPCGLRQRHAGVDTERPRFVGGGGDDLARPAWVAIAADHHRLAGQLGPPTHLDGGEELVEVDVQYPAGRVELVHRVHHASR